MAKGEDAVRRKKNKVTRKRMRNSESSVSARVASIIASKRRRKAGKRRVCEGMCFSLPTPDDPFLDRYDDRKAKKRKPSSDETKKPNQEKTNRTQKGSDTKEKKKATTFEREEHKGEGNRTTIANGEPYLKKCSLGDDSFEEGCLSKFLILCLKAIHDSWKKKKKDEEEDNDTDMDEREEEEEEDVLGATNEGSFLTSPWGAEFWRCCSAGWNVIETSGACATREQVAWIVSTASDIVTRKEKKGIVLPSPFLLYLVSSQEKAVQVRSVCKPLKALGVHTVSLHTGAPVDHQVCGLKSCEPEFLISTPERLLELISLKAIDVSRIQLLVVDGLKSFSDVSLLEKVKSIRENISGEPQMIVFSDCYGEVFAPVVQHLLKGPVHRLSLNDGVASQSAFISQYIHFYTSEEEKLSKALQILNTIGHQRIPQPPQALLIAETASKARALASYLKAEGYAVAGETMGDGLHGADGMESPPVFVKDRETLEGTDTEEFEIVMSVEFPSSIEDYVDILTKMARYSVGGVVHSFFCKQDASLAQPLIEVLEQCWQAVPEALRSVVSS